ncbi:MAG: branched-chain amino acid ABC transporter permease [Deltaproteobacteria bacterium]|nr:branched-chain amino acid ABC transporter permease [Deltaproteobacteria bacterium]
MSLLVANLLAGLAVGGAYALLAVGLVLVHRATGVLNFAHGAVAATAAFVAWAALESGLAVPLAAGAAIAAGTAVNASLGAVLERAHGARHTPILVTIAAMMALEGAVGATLGTDPRPLSLGLSPAAVDGVAAGLAAVAVLALTAFLHLTRAGLAARAVGSRPEAAALAGIPVARTRILTWALAGALAAVAGLLWAPRTLLEPSMMGAPLLAAFAAATLGGLRAPLGAMVGGVALGILETLVRAYVSTELGASLTYVVLLAALLLRPQGLLPQRTPA